MLHTYAGRYDSSVEFGHTYVPDTLTPFTDNWRLEEDIELPVFTPPTEYHQRLVDIARGYSARPLLLALIDDIGKPEDDSFFTELSVIEGLKPEDVYYESGYVEAAKDLVDHIRGTDLPQGWRLSGDERKVIVGTGKHKLKIPLVGFSAVPDDSDHPSCQLIDAAWTLDRIQSVAPNAATILPEAFKTQQQQVAAIASLVPAFENTQVTSVFTNEAGDEAGRFVWPLAS